MVVVHHSSASVRVTYRALPKVRMLLKALTLNVVNSESVVQSYTLCLACMK